MKKLVTALLAGLILTGATLAISTPAQASSDKLTICHATGKDGKYVTETPDKSAVVAGHAGASHQDGQDIIPAFSWVTDGVRHYFDGQNLDKAALLDTDCKAPATYVTASPYPPTYIPASCATPDLPYGRVVVPGALGLGEGVADASRAGLNQANTEWTVNYTLKAPTDSTVYQWPAGFDGTYKFTVVPLSADPLYVLDSRTGVGQCEMPDTGAKSWMLPATIVGGAAILGGALLLRRRRTV
jgi:LPXTG-motif cell wall-anchored protein